MRKTVNKKSEFKQEAKSYPVNSFEEATVDEVFQENLPFDSMGGFSGDYIGKSGSSSLPQFDSFDFELITKITKEVQSQHQSAIYRVTALRSIIMEEITKAAGYGRNTVAIPGYYFNRVPFEVSDLDIGNLLEKLRNTNYKFEYKWIGVGVGMVLTINW